MIAIYEMTNQKYIALEHLALSLHEYKIDGIKEDDAHPHVTDLIYKT